MSGVVFDMGGILHPTPFEVLPGIERAWGLPPGTFPRGPFDPMGDPDYRAMEQGEIREPEYWERVRLRLAEIGIAFEVHEAIDWEGRDRPEVVDAIRRLSTRYPLGLLTNDAADWLGPDWQRRWYLRDHFVAVVDAAVEGIRKPDPRIYRRAAEAIGLAPEACLFVDDLPVNIEGAKAVGMEVFLFDVTDPAGSIDRLLTTLAVGSEPRTVQS
ncbi:MAG: HAD family hydrolase [Candidatus Velamenicoccus archaeovorus]